MTEHKKFEEIKYRAIFIHVDLPGQEDNAKDFPRYVMLQSRLKMKKCPIRNCTSLAQVPSEARHRYRRGAISLPLKQLYY